MVRNALFTKVIREVKSNWKQYLSLVLISALVVALYTGLSANYYHFQDNMNKAYDESNIADLFVTVSKFDENDTEYFSQLLLENESIEKRLNLPVSMNDENLNLYVANEENKISVPFNIKGETGVLVEEKYLSTKNLSIGDILTLSFAFDFNSLISEEDKAIIPILNTFLNEGSPNIFLENRITIQLKITGTMQHAEALSNSSFSTSLIYAQEETFMTAIKEYFKDNYAASNEGINEVICTKVDEILQKSEMSNQFILKTNRSLKSTIDAYYHSKQNNNFLICLLRENMPSNQALEVDVVQAKQLLLVFPIVFYLVGLLIIVTSLSQIINRDRASIGIMTSLGISRKTIVRHYLNFALILTMLGGIIGLIVGPAIIPSVMNQKYKILYSLPSANHQLFYLDYLWCFGIIILVSGVVCVLISRKTINTPPAATLRNMPVDNFKGILLEKLPFFFQLASISLKMALRNIRRHLSRSFMVIIGVMGCMALLLCGFGIDDTLNYGINLELNDKINYDISLTYSNYQEDMFEEIQGIKTVENYSTTMMMVEHDSKTADTTFIILESQSEIFNEDYEQTGCMITSKTASDLGVKAGENIVYFYNNIRYELHVNEIIELFFTQGIIVSKTAIKQSFQQNSGWILIEEGYTQSAIADDISKIEGIKSCITKEEMFDKADDVLSGIRIMTLTVKIFAILLAIVVIYNLAQLNFKERTRDIATLKVLGFSKIEITKTLLYEILILTLIGSLIGMLFGMPLMKIVLSLNETPLVAYIYHINGISYFYALLLTLGVSVVINFYISLLTDHIQMVESLKSVE